MQGEKFHRIFYVQGFGGTHFTKTQWNNVNHAMYVKEWEIHLGGMKFL